MLKKTFLNSQKAFTLVEIMIVVAIIVVLVGIAMTSGNSARGVARDNQRLSNMQLLQIKLEQYRDRKGSYPKDFAGLVGGEASASSLNNINISGEYKYTGLGLSSSDSSAGCENYHLGVLLETKSPSLKKAVHKKNDGFSCGGSAIGANANDFDASDASNNGLENNLWYDMVSPEAFSKIN